MQTLLGSQPKELNPSMKKVPFVLPSFVLCVAVCSFPGCKSEPARPAPMPVPGRYTNAEYNARVRAESRRLQTENPDMDRKQAQKQAQRKVDADMRSLPSAPVTKSETRTPSRRQKQLEQGLEKMGKDGH